jgi:type IV secretory pathway TraG/TraD family ATPase VirD4
MVAPMSLLGGLEWLGHLAQTHPGAVVLAFGLVMLLGLILRATIGRAPKQVPTTHGSARWATRRECRKAGLFGRAGIVLGHAWGHYLRFDGEEHVALIGPTRSWKGRAHIIPTLLVGTREHHARCLGTTALAAHAWCE